jgi:hypothetical protein
MTHSPKIPKGSRTSKELKPPWRFLKMPRAYRSLKPKEKIMKTCFSADTQQMAQIMVNAINASIPMGMGFIHYEPGNISTEEFLRAAHAENFRSIDYYRGRMVKIHAQKDGERFYFYGEPREDYQSWAKKYPSYEALLTASGVSCTVES